MLRRAITGHRRYHHRQCLSHPVPSIPLKNKIPTAPAHHHHRQPFSTSPHADADTSTGPPSPSQAKAAHDGGDGGDTDSAPVPDSRKSSKNTTTEPERDATRGSAAAAAAQGDASPTRQATSRSHPRTRTRALRPLLIPPSFPPSDLLLPLTSEPPPSAQNQRSGKWEQTDENENGDTTRTIALAGLPPNTLKTDLRPIFHPFGEVSRIFLHPGGRRADVEFVDAEGVRRALHAYAERSLHVCGREIVVFRKYGLRANVGVPRRPLFARHTPERRDGGGGGDAAAGQGAAIFVSEFPRGTAREELVRALEPHGKYERFVMRTCVCLFFFLPCSSFSGLLLG
jgi:hypothetical protein